MPYITRSGKVAAQRSPWSVSAIVDFFRAFWAAIAFFFTTLFNPQAVKNARNQGLRRPTYPGRRPGVGPRIVGVENIGGEAKQGGPPAGCSS
ncbi:hypothetical protein PLESTM_000871800 [Pleodorina starrii]|nr:hypothetical protein PLESTM_000871800 [Pleodorina starrii]